jgi:regulator of protease activity HflC (stomatin/prohibitin superfamily)
LLELYQHYDLQTKGIVDCKIFIERYKHHNEKLWDLYRQNKIEKDKLRDERFKITISIFYRIVDPAKSEYRVDNIESFVRSTVLGILRDVAGRQTLDEIQSNRKEISLLCCTIVTSAVFPKNSSRLTDKNCLTDHRFDRV